MFAAKARTQSKELWERNITTLLEEHVSEKRAAVLRPKLRARLYHMLCCVGRQHPHDAAAHHGDGDHPNSGRSNGRCRLLCCSRCACRCCNCCSRAGGSDDDTEDDESIGPSSPHAGQLRRFPTAKLPASSLAGAAASSELGSPTRRWSMEARYLPANVLLAGRLDASVRDGLRMSGLLGSPGAAATVRSPLSGERDGAAGHARRNFMRSGSGERSARMLVGGGASPASPLAPQQSLLSDRAARVAAIANGSSAAAAAAAAEPTAALASGSIEGAHHDNGGGDEEKDEDSGWNSDTAVAVLKDPGVLVLAALRALSDELHRAAGRNPATAERARVRVEREESRRAAQHAAIIATQLGPRFIALPTGNEDDQAVGGDGGDAGNDGEARRRAAAAAFAADGSDSESHTSRSVDSNGDGGSESERSDAGAFSARKGSRTNAGGGRHRDQGRRAGGIASSGVSDSDGDAVEGSGASRRGAAGHGHSRRKGATGAVGETALLAAQIAAMLQQANSRPPASGTSDTPQPELSSRVQQVETALSEIRGLLSALVQQRQSPGSQSSPAVTVPPLVRQGARQQLLDPRRSSAGNDA